MPVQVINLLKFVRFRFSSWKAFCYKQNKRSGAISLQIDVTSVSFLRLVTATCQQHLNLSHAQPTAARELREPELQHSLISKKISGWNFPLREVSAHGGALATSHRLTLLLSGPESGARAWTLHTPTRWSYFQLASEGSALENTECVCVCVPVCLQWSDLYACAGFNLKPLNPTSLFRRFSSVRHRVH